LSSCRQKIQPPWQQIRFILHRQIITCELSHLKEMNETNISPTVPRESAPVPSPGSTETSRIADEARSEMEKLKESARKEGSAAVDQIKSAAQSAVRSAQETGQSFVKSQKESLASRFSEYANAVQSMSEKLRGDESNILAGPAEQAAGSLNRISDYLREKEPAQLLDDLEALARRKPELVFGGLFVVGFAAARFFKASRRLSSRESSMALSTHVEAPDLSWDVGASSQPPPQPYPPVPPAQSVGIP
jgi:gas vesicle protein